MHAFLKDRQLCLPLFDFITAAQRLPGRCLCVTVCMGQCSGTTNTHVESQHRDTEQLPCGWGEQGKLERHSVFEATSFSPVGGGLGRGDPPPRPASTAHMTPQATMGQRRGGRCGHPKAPSLSLEPRQRRE